MDNQEPLENFAQEVQKNYKPYAGTLLYRTGLNRHYEAQDVIQETIMRLIPTVDEIPLEAKVRMAFIKKCIGNVVLTFRDHHPDAAYQCGYCVSFDPAKFCDNAHNTAELQKFLGAVTCDGGVTGENADNLAELKKRLGVTSTDDSADNLVKLKELLGVISNGRLHVTSTSRPSEFKQLGEQGCRQFQRIQFVDVEDWDSITVADSRSTVASPASPPPAPTTEWRGFANLDEWEVIVAKVTDAERETLWDMQATYEKASLAIFKRMDALSPKHRRFVYLLRFDATDMEKERMAEILGTSRVNVWRLLVGESGQENVGDGKSVGYKTPGAYDIFRALYPNLDDSPLANLATDNRKSHRIINTRDFSASSKAPAFAAIARQSQLSKETTLLLYNEGWATMGYAERPKREKSDGDGGGSASGEDQAAFSTGSDIMGNEDNNTQMIHPNSALLLSYLEHDLIREVRSRVHRHLLICGRCVEEVGYLRSVFLAEETLLERLRSLTAQIGEAAQPLAKLFDIPQFARDSRSNASGLAKGLRFAPQAGYKHLTVIDEDEEGQLYLFLLDPKRSILNYPLTEELRVRVPVLPENEPHKWHIFLTDKPIDLPDGVTLDYGQTNTDEGREDRECVLEKFFAPLEAGEVAYQSFVQDISKGALEKGVSDESQ